MQIAASPPLWGTRQYRRSARPTDGGWNPASALEVRRPTQNPDPRKAYVEVRTCYRFTTLIPVNDFLPIGEVYLQRRSFFTVADY